jgi:hypothetical protein
MLIIKSIVLKQNLTGNDILYVHYVDTVFQNIVYVFSSLYLLMILIILFHICECVVKVHCGNMRANIKIFTNASKKYFKESYCIIKKIIGTICENVMLFINASKKYFKESYCIIKKIGNNCLKKIEFINHKYI